MSMEWLKYGLIIVFGKINLIKNFEIQRLFRMNYLINYVFLKGNLLKDSVWILKQYFLCILV